MTKEEAIHEIEKVFEPAFANYIITALTEGATSSDKEQQFCEDMRDATEEERKSTKDYINSISKPTGLQFDDIYEELDFVQPHKKTFVNLQPCEDYISRQMAIDAIKKIHPVDTEYDCTLYDKLDVMCVLKDLPAVSIDPKQKDGMWIMDYRGRMKQCSECGVRFDTWSNELLYDNYCPRCGIPMKNDDITLEEEKNETNN